MGPVAMLRQPLGSASQTQPNGTVRPIPSSEALGQRGIAPLGARPRDKARREVEPL